MHRRGGLLLIGGVVAAGLLGLLAWLGVSVATTASAARDLQAQVEAAQAALARFDVPAAAIELRAAAETTTDLRERMAGPAWSIAESLPVVGSSAQAARALASAADEVASAALPLVDAVGDQATTTGRVMALLGDTDTLRAVRDAATAASEGLAPLTPEDLYFGLDDAVGNAQESLPRLVSTLDEVIAAAAPLRGMLGADGARTWLVLSQNPAEIRPTGGLINAYLLVRVTDGTVEIIEAGSRKNLDDEFPSPEQIPYWGAVELDTASTWGFNISQWASFNAFPDFPAVARLAQAGMSKRGTPVDGVVAIDPTVVAAILAGTGPVEHKGVTLDAAGAVDFFTKGLYEDFPGFDDVAEKDALAMGLTYATIDAALKRPLDASALLDSLGAAIADGHLLAWSPVPDEESWLMTTGVSAAMAQHPNAVSVAFFNGTGGKLDPYVDRDVVIDDSRCPTEGVVAVTVDLANNAPTGLPEYVDVALGSDQKPDPSIPSGFTKTHVMIYAPDTGAERGWSVMSTMTLDGKKVRPSFGGTEGFPTWEVPVELQRGQQTTLTAELEVPVCPDGQVPPTQDPPDSD